MKCYFHQDKLGGGTYYNKSTKFFSVFTTHTFNNCYSLSQKSFPWKGLANNSHIYERLGRAIASNVFFNDFIDSTLTYGNFMLSDHAPITFSSNQGSHSIVREHWNTNITGSRFFKIQQKLIRIKTNLKVWAKSKYRLTTNKFQVNDDKLKKLHEKLWLQPFNSIWIKHINMLLLQREKLLVYCYSSIKKHGGKLHGKHG